MRKTPKIVQSLTGAASLFLLYVCVTRADETAMPKPYILYSGSRPYRSSATERVLSRIRNVNGKSFVIEMNGKEVRVPIGREKRRSRRSLKLTEISAAVANLQFITDLYASE
jgi:hypothetical protein